MDTNSPVYHGLFTRRAEIEGYINHLETCLEKAKSEVLHLNATLGIMGYDVPSLKIRAKTIGTAGLFHRNELGRLILAKLRETPAGLPVYRIAELIARDKGWDTQDKRFMTALADKIGKRVSKMKKRYGLDSVLEDGGWIWRNSL